MSDELDRRAALAMGWTTDKHATTGWDRITDNDGRSFWLITWKPSTDRNDLAELLREVERRGLEFDLDRMFEFPSISATFGIDTAKLCEAACGVLEAANE